MCKTLSFFFWPFRFFFCLLFSFKKKKLNKTELFNSRACAHFLLLSPHPCAKQIRLTRGSVDILCETHCDLEKVATPGSKRFTINILEVTCFQQVGFYIIDRLHCSIQICVVCKYLEKSFSGLLLRQPGWLMLCGNILSLSALAHTWSKLGENRGNTYISVAMNPVSSERKRKSIKTQQQIETVGRERARLGRHAYASGDSV